MEPDDDKDWCYECEKETRWTLDERCTGCGRLWGHPLDT